MRTFVVWTIRLLLFLIPSATAYLGCPPLRLVVDRAAGLSTACSAGEALAGHRENKREHDRVASGIAALDCAAHIGVFARAALATHARPAVAHWRVIHEVLYLRAAARPGMLADLGGPN